MTPAQNSLTSFNGQNPVTSMSSREIADLVEARHDSVKRTVERCAEKGIFDIPPSVGYLDATGRAGAQPAHLTIRRYCSSLVTHQPWKAEK